MAIDEEIIEIGADFSEAIEQCTSLSESFDVMAESTQSAIESVSEFMASLGDSVDALTSVSASSTETTGAVTDLSASFTDAIAQLNVFSATIEANTTALQQNTAAIMASSDATDKDTISKNANNAANNNSVKGLNTLNLALLGAGVVIAGVGIASVKMAGDFQSGLTTLITGAGELQSNLGIVHDGILQIAEDTGTSTDKLVNSMFKIDSASYKGKQGLEVLTAAAEGAKVGNADLAGETDVLTVALHNYGMQSDKAIAIINSLIKSVGDGNMVMDDLNQSLTGVLPTASKAGVALTDIEGALSTMAASGDKGASAGTHLSQMLQSLQNPSSKAADMLKKIGLTTQGISDDMKKSLPDTIEIIYDAIAKKFPVGSAAFNAAAADIVGGNKQVKAWNELTGVSFKDLVNNTNDITDAFKNSGDSVTNWNLVQKDLNQQLDEATQKLSNFVEGIGEQLKPAAEDIVGFFSGPLMATLENAADFFEKNKIAAAALAGVLSGAVVAAIWELTSALAPAVVAATSFAWPFMAIGAAVAGVVAAFKHFYDTCEPFRKTVNRVGYAIQEFVVKPFNNVKTLFGDVHSFIDRHLLPKFEEFNDFIEKHLSPKVTELGNAVKTSMIGRLGDLYTLVDTKIMTVMNSFHGFIANTFIPKLDALGKSIQTSVIDKFNTVKDTADKYLTPAINNLKKAFDNLHDTYEKKIKPALSELWNTIETQVGPTFLKLWDVFTNQVEPALKRLWNVIKPELTPAFKELAGMVLISVIGAMESLTFIINYVVIPSINSLTIGIGLLTAEFSLASSEIQTVIGWFDKLDNSIKTVRQDSNGVLGGMLGGIITGMQPPGHNASGTNYWQGGLTWVGEQGPELVNLPTGSQIIPNYALQGMASSYDSSQQYQQTQYLAQQNRYLAQIVLLMQQQQTGNTNNYTITGNPSITQIYKQIARLGGIADEAYLRGATSGMGW